MVCLKYKINKEPIPKFIDKDLTRYAVPTGTNDSNNLIFTLKFAIFKIVSLNILITKKYPSFDCTMGVSLHTLHYVFDQI
jgi:hypothetical protein